MYPLLIPQSLEFKYRAKDSGCLYISKNYKDIYFCVASTLDKSDKAICSNNYSIYKYCKKSKLFYLSHLQIKNHPIDSEISMNYNHLPKETFEKLK